MNLHGRLQKNPVTASAPCRVDFGGTLDIGAFFLGLASQRPATFNAALDMRTHIRLLPHTPGKIKVSSKGFDSAEFDRGKAPFDHPMGLMFAVAQYFDVHGVHIEITSSSPPRSALGGSSVAQVAVIGAILHALEMPVKKDSLVFLAQAIESGAAGVVCGVQDHLAAVFGGAHLWEWQMGDRGWAWKNTPLFASFEEGREFGNHCLVAYCGIPHVSVEVNQSWVKGFIRGENRKEFARIAQLTHEFFNALSVKDYGLVAKLMNEETEIRLEMTPDVLDHVGVNLFELAQKNACGARFTGAGAGGCVWAVGKEEDIIRLSRDWNQVLESIPAGKVLDTAPDVAGLMVNDREVK